MQLLVILQVVVYSPPYELPCLLQELLVGCVREDILKRLVDIGPLLVVNSEGEDVDAQQHCGVSHFFTRGYPRQPRCLPFAFVNLLAAL